MIAPQSRRRSASSGRVIAPTMATPATPRDVQFAPNSLPTSPRRTQKCGKASISRAGGADDANEKRLAARCGGAPCAPPRSSGSAAACRRRRSPKRPRSRHVSSRARAACSTARRRPRAGNRGSASTSALPAKFRRDVLDALFQRAFRREQRAIGAAQFVDRLARKTAPLQADDIESGERGRDCRKRCRRE